MKIGFLVNEFPSSSETFIQSQIVGVIAAGHEVNIFAGKPRGDLKIRKELEKYQLLECTIYPTIPKNKALRIVQGLTLVAKYIWKNPLPILRSLNVIKYGKRAASMSLLYQIIPFLENQPYDILHCQFGSLGLDGMCIKQVLAGRMKLVTSFRGYDASMYVHNKPGLYKELFAEGALFLPVSHSLKKRILEEGCEEKKIVVLPSGIDCQKLKYSSKALNQGEKVRVITIARLVEKKGIAYGIEAIARVVASGRSIKYSVVGDGDLRRELENLIEKRHLQDHVQLLGWRNHEEVLQLLQESHILIAPSVTANDGDQEGIPNAIKEAMALGLPVIGTYHSGIPELIEDGEDGFLVKERDAEALATCLLRLIDHPEMWSKMGQMGRARVENGYDKKKLDAQLESLYRKLLGKGASDFQAMSKE